MFFFFFPIYQTEWLNGSTFIFYFFSELSTASMFVFQHIFGHWAHLQPGAWVPIKRSCDPLSYTYNICWAGPVILLLNFIEILDYEFEGKKNKLRKMTSYIEFYYEKYENERIKLNLVRNLSFNPIKEDEIR